MPDERFTFALTSAGYGSGEQPLPPGHMRTTMESLARIAESASDRRVALAAEYLALGLCFYLKRRGPDR